MASAHCSADELAIAGGIAGMIEAIAIQPLEIVKTRFQLNRNPNSTILNTLRGLIQEGGVPRLYRGLLPELIGMFPTRSACYGSQELIQRELAERWQHDDGGTTAWIAGLAGSLAGIVESAATTPFQLVKVRLQSPEYNARYRGTFDCVRMVLVEEGVTAFSTGFVSTAWRNAVWNGVYFGYMAHVRGFIAKPESYVLGLMHSLVIGFTGGITATGFNCPFDVAKSRIQGQVVVEGSVPKYMSVFGTLKSIVREEGAGALYKGFTPKALRMGMGGGVAITAFEAVCAGMGAMRSTGGDIC